MKKFYLSLMFISQISLSAKIDGEISLEPTMTPKATSQKISIKNIEKAIKVCVREIKLVLLGQDDFSVRPMLKKFRAEVGDFDINSSEIDFLGLVQDVEFENFNNASISIIHPEKKVRSLGNANFLMAVIEQVKIKKISSDVLAALIEYGFGGDPILLVNQVLLSCNKDVLSIFLSNDLIGPETLRAHQDNLYGDSQEIVSEYLSKKTQKNVDEIDELKFLIEHNSPKLWSFLPSMQEKIEYIGQEPIVHFALDFILNNQHNHFTSLDALIANNLSLDSEWNNLSVTQRIAQSNNKQLIGYFFYDKAITLKIAHEIVEAIRPKQMEKYSAFWDSLYERAQTVIKNDEQRQINNFLTNLKEKSLAGDVSDLEAFLTHHQKKPYFLSCLNASKNGSHTFISQMIVQLLKEKKAEIVKTLLKFGAQFSKNDKDYIMFVIDYARSNEVEFVGEMLELIKPPKQEKELWEKQNLSVYKAYKEIKKILDEYFGETPADSDRNSQNRQYNPAENSCLLQ